MCLGAYACAATGCCTPCQDPFYSSHHTTGIRQAFGSFNRSGSLSEQEEIPLTSRVRVWLVIIFFLKSVSLCVLQPVLVSHIPQVMTHYPSTQNTVSPRYFTAMIKSTSHTCCFITLILKLGPIITFMTNLEIKIQVIAFMINPLAALGQVLPFIFNHQNLKVSILVLLPNLECKFHV